MTCNICNREYVVKEEYGKDGSDEYSEMEVGHIPSCIYYNIDPMNRKYLPEEMSTLRN